MAQSWQESADEVNNADSLLAKNPQLKGHLEGLAKLETAGGKKTIKGPGGTDSNNLYNVKGPGYTANDKAEGSNDSYRTYPSSDASTIDVVNMLKRKYPGAVDAKTPADFAKVLKTGGYATDPDYVAKLTATATQTRAPQPRAEVAPVATAPTWQDSVAAVNALDKTPAPVAAPPVAAPAPDDNTPWYKKSWNPLNPNSFIADAATSAPADAAMGVGEGFSAGLTKYPAAAISMLANGGTYKDALAGVRGNLADAEIRSPYAYGGGKITGQLLGSVGGGGSLAALAGRGALLGGTQGYTENTGNLTDVGDLAKGAITGAAFGAASRLPAVAVEKMASPLVNKQLMDGHSAWLKTLLPQLTKATPAEKEALLQAVAQAGGTPSQFAQTLKSLPFAARKELLTGALERGGSTAGSYAGATAANAAKVATGAPMRMLQGATTGATGGAVAGAMSGDDPITGALYGAATGGLAGAAGAAALSKAAVVRNAATNATNYALQHGGVIVPNAAASLSEMGGRMATRYGTEAVTAPVDNSPGARLRRLADGIRGQ